MDQDEAVRLATYAGYVDDGRPPTVEHMAAALEMDPGVVPESLARLHEARHVVLGPGNEPGYVMDLATLWRLASRWYESRLEPGYERREPVRAREYFREVGLICPIWGLE